MKRLIVLLLLSIASICFGIGGDGNSIDGMYSKTEIKAISNAPRNGLIREYLPYNFYADPSGYVSAWRDTSASATDAIQSTAIYQPKASYDGGIKFVGGVLSPQLTYLATFTIVANVERIPDNYGTLTGGYYQPAILFNDAFCIGLRSLYGRGRYRAATTWAVPGGWNFTNADSEFYIASMPQYFNVVYSRWDTGEIATIGYFNSFINNDISVPDFGIASGYWNGHSWEYPPKPAPSAISFSYIGNSNPGTTQYCYGARIKAIRIYNRVLSRQEIASASIWDDTFIPSTVTFNPAEDVCSISDNPYYHLKAHNWHLNGNKIDVWYDSSGNERHFTQGTEVYQPTVKVQYKPIKMTADCTGGLYVQKAHTFNMNTWTLAIEIPSFNTYTNDDTIYSLWGDSCGWTMLLWSQSGIYTYLRRLDYFTMGPLISGSIDKSMIDGKSHVFAFTADKVGGNRVQRFFVDGVFVSSNIAAPQETGSNITERIGRGYNYLGKEVHAAVAYDRVLSDSEIAGLNP